ncbi:class A beta-lactamase-related serine hydrolase [Micromonospora sp. DR5-3]|uniref:serine hydrolase n=1 Tax=unclassified Micromonospora TaxID=2617518 RepID=UPI0011DB248D|nr:MULTISPECIES: serine hydrolase [unclassified Micromonospora]MCW3817020.1 class A beta-lactamase-related serine hydrolase [Micromonospora sp. DR5-3]TYC21730.1 serine hydrolase [Micromonospora sp. MP36]
MTWEDLDSHLDKVPGTVSAYVGRLGARPTWTRLPDATHYAASTMKVGVLVALHRAAEAGRLDLDAPVPVHNGFDSALPGAPRFANDRDYDNDDAVWARVGASASLRWLAERMIVRSSNLATNIIIGAVGLPAVAEAWTLSGARHSVTGRGIEDSAAREAGIDNLVTAADLAALLGGLARSAREPGPLASPAGCASMLDVLFAQEHREDLAAGLPTGTRIAHKNGWVRGIRHGAGVVFPADAPPYVIVVCTTTDLADGGPSGEEEDDACRLIAHVSAQVWESRHDLAD